MNNFYDRMIEWRERHISEKHLVLLLSFFVGAFSAAAAAILKSFIHFLQWFVQEHLIFGGHTWWYLITPIIGITLAALFVKYIVRDDIMVSRKFSMPSRSANLSSRRITCGRPSSVRALLSVSAVRSEQRLLSYSPAQLSVPTSRSPSGWIRRR